MRDFYEAEQEEEESIPSSANKIGGLLSKVREKFPNQVLIQKEQELLRHRLFHGCRKSIKDSVKYCHADPRIDYMSSLEGRR